MRCLILLTTMGLLCTACEKPHDAALPPANAQWFRTYQTDHTCQIVHPSHEDPFLRGPTGRAHPF